MSRIRNEVSHNILIMSGISTEFSHVYLCQELELKYLMFIMAGKSTSCLSLTGISAKVPVYHVYLSLQIVLKYRAFICLDISCVSLSGIIIKVSLVYIYLEFVLKYFMFIYVRK